jgi:hypothetical protein
MTFKKFNKDLIDFVMQIIKDDDFLLCHKLLANCENHEFNDDVKFDSIKSMLIQLSELNFFIAHFLLKEMEYLRLLKAIDNSNVEPVHKDILMKNADNIFSDVIVFHYAYNKNENFHDGINQIRSIYFKNNKLSKVQPFSLNAYDDTVYFPIQNLRIKYIDEK